ncbi:MAG: hypothetical protein H0X38_03055 [Planctomycetes bacterium]|nr:hypothetical protein [Planctomycetota bacterium]
MTTSTNIAAPRNGVRRGSALVVAMVVMVASVAMLMRSSDSVSGSFKLLRAKLIEQKVLAAAEAVCSSHETELSNRLTAGDFNALNIWTSTYGQNYFGDCQVKWRIEPVMIGTPLDPANASYQFVANPDPNPNAVLPSAPQLQNTDLYHYRIATEAVYSENGVQRCKAQAVRVVQMSLTMLFRYAIFYGQTGPAGDIEFAHGPDLSVLGGIHTNGALYMGGSSCPGPTNTTAGVNTGGQTIIGASNNKVTVTAVNGVFLMNKRYNYYNHGGASYPAALDPNNPDPTKITDSSLFYTSGSARTINGTAMTYTSDSRGDPSFKTNSLTTWGGYVRTSVTGATVIKTLSNIPELAGRPTEPVRLNDATGMLEQARQRCSWQTSTMAQVPAPQFAESSTGFDANYLANGVYVSYSLGQKEAGGVGWTKETNPVNLATTFISPPQVPTAFLYHMQTFPTTTSTPTPTQEVIPVVAGLIIRERPTQFGWWKCTVGGTVAVPTWNWSWDPGVANTATRQTAPPFPTVAQYNQALSDNNAGDNRGWITYWYARYTYSSYMASQYQVNLGRLDITNSFFYYLRDLYVYTGSVVSAIYPTATDDAIFNRREYWAQGKYNAASMPQQSILTLNWNAIQNMLRNSTLQNLNDSTTTNWNNNSDSNNAGRAYFGMTINGAAAPGTDPIRSHFNGLIFVNRANRNAYDATTNPTGVKPNGFEASPHFGFNAAVRLAQASDISWNHIAATNPLGTSKLTVVTPNQMFFQGDLNTITHVDAAGVQQTTPVAVMCDMVTVLTNNWSDASNNSVEAPASGAWYNGMTGGATTSYNVALVVNNMPTVQSVATDDASVHTFAWYLEDWGGTDYYFKGSIVVLNGRRYGCGFNCGNSRTGTPGLDIPTDRSSPAPNLYGAPTRHITFNNDLLTSAGTPPFAPHGTALSRQVNYSYVVMTR